MFQKKSLGQNFLKNLHVVSKIVEAGDVKENETVLEIGPGKGVMTAEILRTGAQVIAIEKDHRLIPILSEQFAKEIKTRQLRLLHGDVSEMSIADIGLQDANYKLVANIPYYITGLIIRKFLETAHRPHSIVVLVQKEVAKRIIAQDGKESLLSISVKAYGEPRYVGTVKAGNFNPPPNVSSAILSIINISDSFFTKYNITEKDFFKILKTGFAGKRKMLLKKLSVFENTEILQKIFEDNGISTKVRAEDMTLDDWGSIVSEIKGIT